LRRLKKKDCNRRRLQGRGRTNSEPPKKPQKLSDSRESKKTSEKLLQTEELSLSLRKESSPKSQIS